MLRRKNVVDNSVFFDVTYIPRTRHISYQLKKASHALFWNVQLVQLWEVNNTRLSLALYVLSSAIVLSWIVSPDCFCPNLKRISKELAMLLQRNIEVKPESLDSDDI